MAYLDQLGRLSFGGVTLPYQRIRIRGGVRDFVHEYPKVAGGLAEKLGRKLYEITITLRIDEGLSRTGFYQGRNLLANINTLMWRFEAQETDELYLPNIGAIKAYCTQWERDLDVKVRSGETVELQFREDNDSAYLIQKTLLLQPPSSLPQYLGNFEQSLPTPHSTIFDTLRDAVNGILAFRDQGQMWAGFVAMKIDGLIALIEEADAAAAELQDPLNSQLAKDFRMVWAGVRELGETIGSSLIMNTHTVTRDMSCADLSLALYGDTEHSVDLLNLNALDDPYMILAGTAIRYFKNAA